MENTIMGIKQWCLYTGGCSYRFDCNSFILYSNVLKGALMEHNLSLSE